MTKESAKAMAAEERADVQQYLMLAEHNPEYRALLEQIAYEESIHAKHWDYICDHIKD